MAIELEAPWLALCYRACMAPQPDAGPGAARLRTLRTLAGHVANPQRRHSAQTTVGWGGTGPGARGGAATASSTATAPGFDALIGRAEEMAGAGRFHGATLAVGWGGAARLVKAFGSTPPTPGEGRLMPPDSPVEEDTIFITASLTKPLAGLAIMQLVEAGRLDLDATVVSFLPDFVSGDPRKAAVTVRLLVLAADKVAPQLSDFSKDISAGRCGI